jgi:phage terminase large subunit-like protein
MRGSPSFSRSRITFAGEHRRTGASLQVNAADTDVITGGKLVATIIDELHVLVAKRNAADILVEIGGALAARQEGFLKFVTTQSKQPPRGVFKSKLKRAREVRDGVRSLPILPTSMSCPSA